MNKKQSETIVVETEHHILETGGSKTLVPSQHPRPWHRLCLAGHCVLPTAPGHPFSDLRVDPQGWLGPTVVSGESQVLQGRLGISPSAWSHQGGLGDPLSKNV